jgi:RND superfamily putative drug exporter
VVSAAAIIMTAVFGAFVLADDPVTKSIGLSLAVGVLADAFIVRMTLVPAVMAMLGDRAWHLPGWLDRHLPNLDIEGESLHRDAPEPEAPPEPVPVGESTEPGAEEPAAADEPAPGRAGA